MEGLVIVSNNILFPGKAQPSPGTIVVDEETGKIHEVLEHKVAQYTLDAGDLWVLPGLVDAHVHLNEPGRTNWEGFRTGTLAAISGGVTTVIDMPLNSIPPTTTLKNLICKKEASSGQCWTDVGFWGGIIPGNHKDLAPLVSAGVKGFKCFLIESGVEEFPCVVEEDLKVAMEALEVSPSVILYHAEMASPTNPHNDEFKDDPSHYSTFLKSRPPQLETDAIKLVIELQKEHPTLRSHIVHLSAAEALPLIREAKANGLNITVETCFHYLCLNSEDVPNGHPEFKCCPPIRDDSNRQALWEALEEGTIDCVVSDHSPCVASLKRVDTDGDFMSAWGGISTLGLGLSLLWTEGQKRGLPIGKIIEWTSTNSARHASLGEIKGSLSVGYDADFIFWDPDVEFKVTKEYLNFKNKLSPYEGLKLKGQVEKAFIRGKLAWNKDEDTQRQSPQGKLL